MPHFEEGDRSTRTKERASDPGQSSTTSPRPRSRRRSPRSAEHGDDAKILAGGQSLLPVLRMRLNAPEVVIDLGGIDSLRGIRDDGDAIVIGAMTTHHDVRDDAWSRSTRCCCPRRPREVADSQIRHRGTFGGALAHADPAGDLGAPALALGAQFVIAGPGGTRTVDGRRTSSSTSSRPPSARTRSSPRCGSPSTPAGARTTRSSCASPTSGRSSRSPRRSRDGGTIDEARVGLTNMGSTPLRATRDRGRPSPAQPRPRTAYARRPQLAAEGTNPPSDLNGAADYRQHLAAVLTGRAVLAAAGG